LMQDVVRVLSQFLKGRSHIRDIHLVETSHAMQETQKRTLGDLSSKHGFKVNWHSFLDEIPYVEDQYTMILAHEFFDALPFHLLQNTHEGWKEILISSAPDPAKPTILKPTPSGQPSSSRDDRLLVSTSPQAPFRPVLSSTASITASLLGRSSPRFSKIPVGSRLEVSLESFKIAQQIAYLLRNSDNAPDSRGCGLLIDYGGDKAYGNSFRAFKNHNIVDVFHRPGECDLTVNVDFAYLKEALSREALPLGPLSQADFLKSMAIEPRVESLVKSAKTDESKKLIEQSAKRLIDLTGMGSQYQVLGVLGRYGQGSGVGAGYPFTSPEEVDNLRGGTDAKPVE